MGSVTVLELWSARIILAFLLRLMPGLGNGSLHLIVPILVHLLHESHQTGPWVFTLVHLGCLGPVCRVGDGVSVWVWVSVCVCDEREANGEKMRSQNSKLKWGRAVFVNALSGIFQFLLNGCQTRPVCGGGLLQ